MLQNSAGIILFKQSADQIEVFLVHPGGPYWQDRDEGAWSIAKGLIEDGENALQAARREFEEETGFIVDGKFIDLGAAKVHSKKIVHAWALEQDVDASQLRSNNFELEWPKGSGILRDYPEVDRGAWFDIQTARVKIHKGQEIFIDRLLEKLLPGC